jgi:hypothetical protein
VHRFETATGEELPMSLVITSRACPSSPVIRFNLAYDHIDAERNVAVYEVIAFGAV